MDATQLETFRTYPVDEVGPSEEDIEGDDYGTFRDDDDDYDDSGDIEDVIQEYPTRQVLDGGWGTIPAWVIMGLMAIVIMITAISMGILWGYQSARFAESNDKIIASRIELTLLSEILTNLTIEANTTCCDNITESGEYPDDTFAIYQSSDPSVRFQFNVSAVTAGIDRIYGVQNRSGDLACLAQIPGAGSVFQSNAFGIIHAGDNTTRMNFDLGSVSSGFSIILTIQALDGTILLVENIPAQPTEFADNVLEFTHFADPTAIMQIDCGGITPGLIQLWYWPDEPGTIAYTTDTGNDTAPVWPVSESNFTIVSSSDPSAAVGLDLSNLPDDVITITLTVQDKDGTVACTDEISDLIMDATVTTSGLWPPAGNLSTLGDVHTIALFLCGAGGGAGAGNATYTGGGGGSGSGFEMFTIISPLDRFYRFNITIGAGGAGSGTVDGADGGDTILVGLSSTDFWLTLTGYGGGGGLAIGNGGDGGAGGGGGGPGVATVAGIAGDLGGLVGGNGSSLTGMTDGQRGGFKLPWRSGGGGGSAAGNAAAWQGGFAAPSAPGSGGASSMFGMGGGDSGGSDDGGPCAGGGASGTVGGDGGDGQVVIRSYLTPP